MKILPLAILVIHMYKIAHLLNEKIDHAVPTQILKNSSYFVSSITFFNISHIIVNPENNSI
jgi:hypothetical protein